MRAVILSYPPTWTSSAGMLSTPADFPLFKDSTAASTSLRRMEWSSSVSATGQSGSPLALWLYSSDQCSVHPFSICRSSVRHFPEQSWTVVAFPCFRQVFHNLVCPLTTVLPQLFFNLTKLFSLLVFFCLFRAPLDVVVHFPVFLRSFRFKPFLSQFSPFIAQIKNICSDPGFFLLTVFAKGLTGCFSHCCVEGGDHKIHVCIFTIHDGERCKLPAYHSLEDSNTLGSFSFLR